jgi:DNA-binding XRE family transcriptional regulator
VATEGTAARPSARERIVEAVRAAVAAVDGWPGTPVDIHIQIAGDSVRVRSIEAPRPDGRDGVPVSFADWFKRRLRDRELSHEAVARRIGVSTKTITRWVTGRTEPRFRELIEICTVLGDSPL